MIMKLHIEEANGNLLCNTKEHIEWSLHDDTLKSATHMT